MLFGLIFLLVLGLAAGCDQNKSITQPINDDYVSKAIRIIQTEQPSEEEILWLDSLTDEQISEVFSRMRQSIPVDSVKIDTLDKMESGQLRLAAATDWQYEYIEKQQGGGTGCYSAGFWNDPDCRCGHDWPPDKVYYFPCSNYANRGAMRIWSTDWRSRTALRSGVSARVYSGSVQICVGYWSLYCTLTNPYTLMSTTYIYW